MVGIPTLFEAFFEMSLIFEITIQTRKNKMSYTIIAYTELLKTKISGFLKIFSLLTLGRIFCC